MDAMELAEWQMMEIIEPFGDKRGDIQSGMIACTMANAWRGKNSTPFTLFDFIPKFGKQVKQTHNDMKNLLKQFAGKFKK